MHRHKYFITFLGELNAGFIELPVYRDVSWLNAEKILPQFFGLWTDILLFLQR